MIFSKAFLSSKHNALKNNAIKNRSLTRVCLAVFIMVISFAAASCAQKQEAPGPEVSNNTADTAQTTKPTDASNSAEIRTAEPSPSPNPESTPIQRNVQPILSESEQFPALDGSTACMPLMALTKSRTTGIDLERAQDSIYVSTTANAYDKLVAGGVSLLLAYEPSENAKKRIAESKVELDMRPIGRDALVFIVNEGNPVESLTWQQIVDIYSGKIKNWKEVGGADAEIAAHQRDPDSGSQALFLKLVMRDVPPIKPLTGLEPNEMDDLMQSIAGFSDSANALGFSVYYYAKNMYAVPGLRFIAVDGVAPSDATIADGSYPFVNEFYAVTRKNEPGDSPASRVRDWLLSDDGRQCIKDAGYVTVD